MPPSGKTVRQTPKQFLKCKDVLEVLYHYAKFGGARISPAAGVAKNVEFFCLFVRHAFVVWFPRRSLGGASVRLPFISFNNRTT